MVLLRGLLFTIAIIIAAYALIAAVLYLMFFVDACISTTRSRISVAGLGFQVEDTNCDTLAKEEWVSVYGFADRDRGRTLLFRYSPASYHLPLPTIEVPDQRTIIIAIPIVSSVYSKLDSWHNHSIRYDIGHIDYP